MSGVVDLPVTLRLDPAEPATAGECTLTAGLDGRPVVVVRDLLTVDELKLGHIVSVLLTNAELDLDDPILAAGDAMDDHARTKGRLL